MCIIRGDGFFAAVTPIRTLALPSANTTIIFSAREVMCYKFIEKHLCQGLFVNKVAGCRPATLLKKRL